MRPAVILAMLAGSSCACQQRPAPQFQVERAARYDVPAEETAVWNDVLPS